MSLDQGLELIRQKFLVKLQGLVPEFEAFAKRLDDQASDLDDMTEQRVFVHQIAGSARTFGFSETSELASRAEEFIDILLGESPAQDRQKDEVAAGASRALNRLSLHAKELIATQLTAVPTAEAPPRQEKTSKTKARPDAQQQNPPDQGLELIRQKFLVKLQGLVPEFEAFAKRLDDQASDLDDMTEQRVFVHQIAGSARTFGFSETSELASRAEEFIDILLGESPAQDRQKDEVAAGASRALNRLSLHAKELIATQLTAVPTAEAPPPDRKRRRRSRV